MKEWFSKYWNLVFAICLVTYALWFTHINNWDAAAGYALAAMAWGALWFIDRARNNIR